MRLQFGAAANSKGFVAYSTDLSFHISNTLENSTTKDDTDVVGAWVSQEKTKQNIDGSVTAIMDAAEAQNFTGLSQESNPLVWELDWVDGAQNRVVSTKICSGDNLVLSNVEISAPRDGFCTLTGSFVIYGAVAFS